MTTVIEQETTPSVLTQIQYQKPNVGYCPSFVNLPILHGFSWGKDTPNMAYKWHQGDPSLVTERIEAFLHSLGMASLPQTLVIEAYTDPGKEIVDVTSEYLATATSTSHGIFTAADCVFTTLPQVPITIKPGDCTASLVYGLTREGLPLVGIIHAGRHDLESLLPQKTIQHLTDRYGCDPRELSIGIVPNLGVAHHIIQEEDIEHVLGKRRKVWERYSIPNIADGSVHLDDTSFLKDQYLQSGISPAHIEIYDIDTYTSARLGESFSHRYATATNQPHLNGRFIVAIQLL